MPCFEESFYGGNTLGLGPASLPHTLGYACTRTSPLPRKVFKRFSANFLSLVALLSRGPKHFPENSRQSSQPLACKKAEHDDQRASVGWAGPRNRYDLALALKAHRDNGTEGRDQSGCGIETEPKTRFEDKKFSGAGRVRV